jgi:hypothetical protein
MRLLLVPERSVPTATLFPQDAADRKPPPPAMDVPLSTLWGSFGTFMPLAVALAWTPDGNPIRVLTLAAYLYFL